MNKTEKTKAFFDNGKMIRFVMLGIAVALSVKYIFVDFGIDAEFQISMSYRLAKGDIMFKEMWEPHQMSAFLCAFFIKIYMWLFHTTTGIVLYLQVIGVLLNAAVAYCFYQVVNKYLHCSNTAFAVAWVFFIVSPKDVPLPEYANMQVWFSALLCVTLFVYYKTEKKRWVILSALCLCGAALAYPSCLLLFFGVIYLLLSRKDKVGSVIFGAVCLLAGSLYLYFIFRQISLSDFVASIEHMLALETAHSMRMSDKFIAYWKDAFQIAIFMGMEYIVSCVIVRVLQGKQEDVQGKEARRVFTDVLFFVLVLLFSLFTVVFWEKFTRYSYSLVFVALLLIGTHYRKKLSPDKRYLYSCGMVLSFLQLLATLSLTNLVLVASIPYLLIAVIVSFLPIAEGFKAIDCTAASGILKRMLLLCGVLFLTFRNAYIIRPMCGDVSTILKIAGIVKDGPAIGVVSEYMGPYMQNESMKEWKQYVQPGASIYLIGGALDTLGYLYDDTVVAAPSSTCTPGYNESILEYWRRNPDKYPDVIIASCWYGTMNAELEEDSWMMKWIEEEYQPQASVDGKYWRYYFK